MIIIKDNIIKQALNKFGNESQLLQFYEELHELGSSVNQYRRNKIPKDKLLEEIGDFYLMIEYLKVIFEISDADIILSVLESKEKLTNLLNNEKV